MDRHDQTELAIFAEFARACPLCIEIESIEKRNPPEPDILCSSAERGVIAVEMVELVDRDRVARKRGDQDKLMDALRDAINHLPQDTKAAFINSWIGVKFRPDRSLHKRKGIAERVVNELTKLEPDFEGTYRIKDGETEVASADLGRRAGLVGPYFRVLVTGHFDPIPLDAMREKFQKKYESDFPIQLLAYFDKQEAPLQEQIDELVSFIEENSAQTSFEIAWIFNRSDSRICYPNE